MPKVRKIPHPLTPSPKPGEGEPDGGAHVAISDAAPPRSSSLSRPETALNDQVDDRLSPTSPLLSSPLPWLGEGLGVRAFPRYPAYKDSGVEWLGNIPVDWQTGKLKYSCDHITDGSHYSPMTSVEGYPYVTVRDLKQGIIDVENAEKISEESFRALEKSGCRPKMNDVLFSKDGTIGKVAIVSRDDFVVLSSLAILSPNREYLSQYLCYMLQSSLGISQMESYLAGAALRRITLDTIRELFTIFPPLPEQYSIAAFLDHETSRIDALVAKQEALIALLHEKRRALISHAVTKGLDSAAPMKDSGAWANRCPSGC